MRLHLTACIEHFHPMLGLSPCSRTEAKLTARDRRVHTVRCAFEAERGALCQHRRSIASSPLAHVRPFLAVLCEQHLPARPGGLDPELIQTLIEDLMARGHLHHFVLQQLGKVGSRPDRVDQVNTEALAGTRIDSTQKRHATVPSRLRISKQPVKGPLLAPATITADSLQASASQQGNTRKPSFAEPQFVFPPRTSVQKRWPHDESHPHVRSFISLDGQYDDDEPTLDIIPSLSRRRKFPLPTSSVVTVARMQQQQ
ncbi:hypothetical protein NDA10_004692 [Ustilago hordei]|uniref:Uncharacterized protein n=1 Tax=Ustilago hordei TaxID=120017 RepID=I2FWZ2_USTHO|nr:uncharacterized protein UHO2_04257 [Ustilago hordei]KAJ1037098.1 hypothetical protein NDA10_004692 [Ustilago hordei]KAJ1573704.1 hypothetical protein NDA15_002064 [Ustilago hordei]KAJ1579662.1 hypothetical protein NDA12_003999 [Ustilago hordei]UTT90988.1 hypothetical protein NDA17_006707 [Ustilago hordei]CCF51435.1 uncharacterized protein UHOR_05400 [Ustilago hordei]